jgi:exopolysaccharide biosynthesis protein
LWQKSHKLIVTIALISSGLIFCAQTALAGENENSFNKCWRELKSDPQNSISQSCTLYHLKTDNGSRASLLVVDLNDHSYIIKPFFNKHTVSVSEEVKEEKALAGINGGFFNLSNGESTSYIVIAGKDQCDPKTNKALISNPELAPYLETIFNRSEFRIIADKDGKLKAQVAAHLDPIPSGSKLIHSLQAGPRLLPQITDTEEAFVRKSLDGKLFDSIGSHKKAARTAIGITKDNHILLLAVADKKQDGFSCGVTLEELAKMLQELGCNQALNCDGGTSTTMIISPGDSRDELNNTIHKEISGQPEKLVKSGLLVQKNTNRDQ